MSNSRVWLITGASSGLGKAFANAALAAGNKVLCAVRKKDGVRDLVTRYGESAYPLTLDVTDDQSVDQAVDEALRVFGRIDVVVNNAGAGVFGAVEELSSRTIEDLIAVNTLGPFRVLKAVLPALRQQRSGHIVNISSMSGFVGEAGTGAYNITKFALEGMSEALAAELKPLGVRVTIVEPGPFRTDFGKAAKADAPPTGAIADYEKTSGKISSMLKDISQWAPGDPAAAAQAVLRIVESANPPLRLVLGSFALQAVRAKLAQVASDLEAWEVVSKSTDLTSAQAGA